MASLYTGTALSNTSLLHEIDDNLLLIAAGRFLIIVGGVVALFVDVQRGCVWLNVGLIHICIQVHGNVQEIDSFQICFYCDF